MAVIPSRTKAKKIAMARLSFRISSCSGMLRVIFEKSQAAMATEPNDRMPMITKKSRQWPTTQNAASGETGRTNRSRITAMVGKTAWRSSRAWLSTTAPRATAIERWPESSSRSSSILLVRRVFSR